MQNVRVLIVVHCNCNVPAIVFFHFNLNSTVVLLTGAAIIAQSGTAVYRSPPPVLSIPDLFQFPLIPAFLHTHTHTRRYLGSGLAMLVVPYIVQQFGPKAQFAASGLLALAWLAMWSRVGSDHPSSETANHGDNSSSAHPPLLQDEAEDGSRWPEAGAVECQLSFKKDDPGPLKLSRGGSSNGGGKPGSRGNRSASPQPRNNRDSAAAGVAGGTESRSGRIPWAVLIKSPAVWAILTSNFAFHYATYVLMNWLPTYFERHIGVGLYDMGNWYTVGFWLCCASRGSE